MTSLIPTDQMVITPYRVPGQHINESGRGVSVTHTPTGTRIDINVSRSQAKNKQIAVEMLEAMLTSPLLRS